jgi:hypothetical protein
MADYIDGISIGGTIYVENLLSAAQSNPNVSQAYINSITINGDVVILDSQYKLNWDERAYISNVTVVI